MRGAPGAVNGSPGSKSHHFQLVTEASVVVPRRQHRHPDSGIYLATKFLADADGNVSWPYEAAAMKDGAPREVLEREKRHENRDLEL